jgi:hypothetical protein
MWHGNEEMKINWTYRKENGGRKEEIWRGKMGSINICHFKGFLEGYKQKD